MVSAMSVVLAGGALVDGGVGGPDPADCGEAVVLDTAVGDGDGLAGGSRDGCGSGVGLQCAVGGKSGSFVADFGEHPGSGEVGQAGKAGDDVVVGVVSELLGRCLPKFVGTGAGGVEHCQQRQGLAAHRLLHEFGLAQLRSFQSPEDVGGEVVDAALPACAAQRGCDTRLGDSGRVGGRRGDGEKGAGFGFGEVGGGSAGEGLHEGRVVLAQDRALLVAGLAAPPDCVLLGTRENCDGLGELPGRRAVGGACGRRRAGYSLTSSRRRGRTSHGPPSAVPGIGPRPEG